MEVRVWLTTVGRGREIRVPGGAGVWTHSGLWQVTSVRIGCSTHADTPKEHKLGLEYNVATIGFVHGIDAAGARIALDNEDLLRSGCIKVDFCAGHEHDVTMDDELDEGDFDGSDDMGSGDEMDF